MNLALANPAIDIGADEFESLASMDPRKALLEFISARRYLDSHNDGDRSLEYFRKLSYRLAILHRCGLLEGKQLVDIADQITRAAEGAGLLRAFDGETHHIQSVISQEFERAKTAPLPGSGKSSRAAEHLGDQASSRNITFTAFSKILLSTASRYLVKGIIPSVGLVVVWGAPKCGKSFFVFDMVAHVAADWEYRGRRVKQRPVVYFALEGQEGFVARIEAFRQVHGVSDIPFFLSSDRIVLPQDGAAVVQSIKDQFPDVKPGIVVLDTLNRSISGSENDPADMGQYVRAADLIRAEFNCVVIVIHHCGVEGGRPRGHTSLTGAADAQLAVKRDAADNIVATVEFMKDGPQGDEIVSSLEQVTVGTDDDGDSITSCVIRPSDTAPTKAKAKVTGHAALALRVLQDTIIDAGEVPPTNSHIPLNTRTIAEKTWRVNCYAGMTTDDTTQTTRQRAFVRASNKLQELKLIGVWGDHVWLV